MPGGSGGWVSPQQALLASQQAAAIQAAAGRSGPGQGHHHRQYAVATGSGRRQGRISRASRFYQRLGSRGRKRPLTARPRAACEKSSGPRRPNCSLDDELANLKLPKSDPTGLQLAKLDAAAVTSTFELLDALALEFAGVVTVEDKIEPRIKRLRKDAKFAEILQEPAAAALWKLGQEYEAKSEACCALLVYEQAAAQLARSLGPTGERLTMLQADKAVVAASAVPSLAAMPRDLSPGPGRPPGQSGAGPRVPARHHRIGPAGFHDLPRGSHANRHAEIGG